MLQYRLWRAADVYTRAYAPGRNDRVLPRNRNVVCAKRSPAQCGPAKLRHGSESNGDPDPQGQTKVQQMQTKTQWLPEEAKAAEAGQAGDRPDASRQPAADLAAVKEVP